jgi:hypothetical protein
VSAHYRWRLVARLNAERFDGFWWVAFGKSSYFVVARAFDGCSFTLYLFEVV